MSHLLGHVGFRPEKMCAFQRSSEHVVIRRVARLSRIGARLMFGPPGHAPSAAGRQQPAAGSRQPAAGAGPNGRPAALGGLRGTLGEEFS